MKFLTIKGERSCYVNGQSWPQGNNGKNGYISKWGKEVKPYGRVELWTIRGILHSLSTKSRVKHSMVG